MGAEPDDENNVSAESRICRNRKLFGNGISPLSKTVSNSKRAMVCATESTSKGPNFGTCGSSCRDTAGERKESEEEKMEW